ncbi:hypothetical protein ACSTJP_00605, partial [Vibrio parahaemolyticus]
MGMGLALIILNSDDTIKKFPLFTILGILGIAGGVAIMATQPIDAKTPFGLYQPVGIFANNI